MLEDTKDPPIFISFAKEDRKFVDDLAAQLRQFFKVWCYTEDMEPGTEVPKTLLQKIKAASAVIVVISEHSGQSNWVMKECKFAKDFRKRIIPLKLDNDLNQLTEFLGQIAYIDAQNGREYKTDLLRALMGFMNELQKTLTARRRISFALKSGVFIIAVLSLVWMRISWDRPLRNFFSLEAIQMLVSNQPPAVPLPIKQTIKYYGDSGKDQLGRKFDVELSKRFKIDTGIEVVVEDPKRNEQPFGYKDYEARLNTLKQAFEAKDENYDVVMIDVVWVGELADHLVDLKDYIDKEVIKTHKKDIIDNNTIDGRLLAMPWFIDFGLLYYRTDLMPDSKQKAPKTWEDLEKRALEIQKKERESNSEFIGFAWQGAQYEGLSVNALEWIGSQGGLDKFGQINNKKVAIKALDRVRGWVQKGESQISEGLNDITEDKSLEKFINGNAAFLRMWPSAYAKIKQADKLIQFNVAPLPTIDGQKSVSIVGGWQLAIPKYSRNQQAAAQFIRYLVSPEVQAWRALEGAYVPTIYDIIENKDNKYPWVKEAMPFLNLLDNDGPDDPKKVFRPSSRLGQDYSKASKCFYTMVYNAIQSAGPKDIVESEFF
jgi:trehalose/maltose transport system substrate-binding protein